MFPYTRSSDNKDNAFVSTPSFTRNISLRITSWEITMILCPNLCWSALATVVLPLPEFPRIITNFDNYIPPSILKWIRIEKMKHITVVICEINTSSLSKSRSHSAKSYVGLFIKIFYHICPKKTICLPSIFGFVRTAVDDAFRRYRRRTGIETGI